MRIRVSSFVPLPLVALVLLAAGARPAGAQAPTCVTVCQAKADACAVECTELSGDDFAACQLTCAKALFQSCVATCQETDEVVWDDYLVTDPARSGEGSAGTD